ncbi:MAG: response regulator [Anaerolineaceae bacterium]|nr:response regulator [Anaerolineaceae bacterium]MCB9099946.1 response regulator [Anaerolineales bacterium]
MKKILCVDDAPDMLKLLARMLEMRGYEVAMATNGLEAIRKAESWQPNLIITDIIMPYMDGLDAITAIRKNPQTAKIPIIVFTASIDADDRKRALELGADEQMPKPFDFVILDNLLQRFLGPNSSIQNLEQSRQDEIREASIKVLLAQKMDLAYQVKIHQTNPDLAATLVYFTTLTRDIVHSLRNRFGIMQSYLPQARYCLHLLEGLTLLHLKPTLSQNFFDGTVTEIALPDLMKFSANRYKVLMAEHRRNGKPPGLTLKGWLDSELLSLSLWLLFQGISGRIPSIDQADIDPPTKHLIQIRDNCNDNPNFGLGLTITLPSYPASYLLKLDDLKYVLQGNATALGLMLLKKTVFLNGGTCRVTNSGEIDLKIPFASSQPDNVEEMEWAISQFVAELPTVSRPYETYQSYLQNLSHGLIEAMVRELDHIAVEARHDDYLITNQKFLNTVLRNCAYARLLLENLRWLGAGTDPACEAVDLTQAVQSVREILRSRIRDRAEDQAEGLVDVEQDFASDLPPICANRIAVEQILLNLIMNALEAMPHGGTLRLGASLRGGQVCLEVSDSGHGIPPQSLPAIFEIRFTTKQRKDYGTGLYVVRSIIDRLGGRIEVASQPDVGTKFSLYFTPIST